MQTPDYLDPSLTDDPNHQQPNSLKATDEPPQASDRYLDQLVAEILAIAKPKPAHS